MSGFYSAGLFDVIPDSGTDHWQFEEGSGSTAANRLASRPLDINGPTWQSDSNAREGFYLQHDGVDDVAVNTADISHFSAVTEVSASVWIRSNDGDGDRSFLFSANDSGDLFGGSEWGLHIEGEFNDGVRGFAVGSSNSVTVETSTFPSGEWEHWGMRFRENDTLDVFYNGSEIASETHSISQTQGTASGFSVGGAHDGSQRNLTGDTDDPWVGIGEFWTNETFQEIYESHPRV